MRNLRDNAGTVHLKMIPEAGAIPATILSSSREPRGVEWCYRMGINAYAVSPSSMGKVPTPSPPVVLDDDRRTAARGGEAAG